MLSCRPDQQLGASAAFRSITLFVSCTCASAGYVQQQEGSAAPAGQICVLTLVSLPALPDGPTSAALTGQHHQTHLGMPRPGFVHASQPGGAEGSKGVHIEDAGVWVEGACRQDGLQAELQAAAL